MSVRLARQPPPRLAPARYPNGTVLGIGFAVVINVGALVGAARALTVVFVAGGVGIAYWLARTRPILSLEFTVWLWLLGPQVRRVIDYATAYHEPSLVLAAAPLASLVMMPRIRGLRWQRMHSLVRPLLLTAAAIATSYLIGAARIGLRPATVELLVWLVPVLFGLQVVAVGHELSELRAMTERVMTWGALIVGVYGIVQFYVVPGWDAFWMDNAGLLSIGTPEPFEIRVFSTLNSPGPMATFLVAAVLFLTGARHRLRLVAQMAGYACLGLSLVRSAWLACLLGLVVVLAAGRPRAKIAALFALGVVAIGVLQISGPVQTVISERIEESRGGHEDDSFQGRVDRHQQIVPMLADEALGRGLGATGSGLPAGGATGFTAFDSGLLEYGYVLGLPAGLLVLAALTYGTLDVARAGLRYGALSAGLVAGALSVLVQMVSGNTLSGVGGITFFLLLALMLRHVQHASVNPMSSATGRP